MFVAGEQLPYLSEFLKSRLNMLSLKSASFGKNSVSKVIVFPNESLKRDSIGVRKKTPAVKFGSTERYF